MGELRLDCQQFISASFIFVTQAASGQRASSNWSWHLPNMKATNHTFLLGLISSRAPLQTSAHSGTTPPTGCSCLQSSSGLREKMQRAKRAETGETPEFIRRLLYRSKNTCKSFNKAALWVIHGWAVNRDICEHVGQMKSRCLLDSVDKSCYSLSFRLRGL